MFEYTLNIGEYSDDTRLSITIKVKKGLEPEDYNLLRTRLNYIEELINKYVEPVKTPEESE